MKCEVTFEDPEKIYRFDFLKIARKLGLTEEEVKKAVLEAVSES